MNDSLRTNDMDNGRIFDSDGSDKTFEPDTTVGDMDVDNETACSTYNISVESEESIRESEATPPKEAAKKKKVNVWTESETFETFEEAEKFLNENGFGSRDVKHTSQGTKTYYACKAVARRSKNKCDAQRVIFEPASETGFKILGTGVHTHNDFDEADLTKRMSPELTKFIIDQRKKHMTGDNIIKSIQEMKNDLQLFPNDKIPSRKQIYYITTKYRLAETTPIVSVGELVEWCEKNAQIPDDEDEPFVIAYDHSNENENRFFQWALSTKRLLKHCAASHLLCVDATYKLNWMGFPFIVVGTVDRVKKFHPLCVALCTSETENDFAFVFKAITDRVNFFFNKSFSPKILVADGSFAIRNAFENSFTDIEIMIMCYVHVLRNVRRAPLKNAKKNRGPIMKDIHRMHLAQSEQMFHEMAALFLKKWAK